MRLLRTAGIALGAISAAVLALAAGLFAAMSVTNSPVYAWRILAYQESDPGDWRIFPNRPVLAPAVASPLAAGPRWDPGSLTYPYRSEERSENLQDLLMRTETNAFLIVQDDRIVFEHYAAGSARDAVNTSFSTAKSVVSTLIGIAISEGLIKSLADPVIAYVPEIAGRGLDTLTIRDLVLMNTGIRYVHDDEQPFYMSPFGDDARSYYSDDMRKVALSVVAGDMPVGQDFRYNNYHLLLEGLILERAAGMPVAEYLEQRIWQPMGAEFDASWSLDSEASGFEKMESGINARAVDFARFGLVFLHGGVWNGRRIVPAGWVGEATSPLEPDQRSWEVFGSWPKLGGYYKYHWWGLTNPDGTHDFMARGKFDQLIYVAPRKNAVVVRLGNAPDEAVQWPLVVRALVDRLPPPK